ncbi:hypothetical protein COT42_01290 [Candidatus Saganbacteria bacterium CG08_land_8_20_14_0_20_45_16]|uniref:Uncharacterized protein n=1 Tax=Candidatus Saganbacteria bacterium CG08_land_8_20_14_0_20_45_16 TaxID=2014293 RepID=A0A2H0Y1A2_UNCSA|nr:MAG: hypothetical protein COT42_01290 [Candidatus Saganbacteria bacterium CG08_land_8_20_14_0_20_45_16]
MKWYYGSGLASLLVVGLGQIIKGDSRKGLSLLLLFYFVAPALIYLSLAFNFPWLVYLFGFTIISAILMWLYSLADALAR